MLDLRVTGILREFALWAKYKMENFDMARTGFLWNYHNRVNNKKNYTQINKILAQFRLLIAYAYIQAMIVWNLPFGSWQKIYYKTGRLIGHLR